MSIEIIRIVSTCITVGSLLFVTWFTIKSIRKHRKWMRDMKEHIEASNQLSALVEKITKDNITISDDTRVHCIEVIMSSLPTAMKIKKIYELIPELAG